MMSKDIPGLLSVLRECYAEAREYRPAPLWLCYTFITLFVPPTWLWARIFAKGEA